jgi:hypothetical protein
MYEVLESIREGSHTHNELDFMMLNALQVQDRTSRDLIVQGLSIDLARPPEGHSQKARIQDQESMKQEANSIHRRKDIRCFLAEIKRSKNKYQGQDNTIGTRNRNYDLLPTKLEMKHAMALVGISCAPLDQGHMNRVMNLQDQNLHRFV